VIDKPPDFAAWSWQTPETNPLPDLLQLLRRAKKSIHISAYGFTLPDVVDTLIQAHGRGVDVRLILDSSQAGGPSARTQVARLKKAGVPHVEGRSARGGIIHLKMALVDDHYLWTGSWNWSVSATLQDNDCYLACLPSPPVKRVEKFNREWDRLLGLAARPKKKAA
jgi:phosphatidylserine/phosphatidylglycerophosphate/cardiolipin synthase-like enzyme